MKTENPCAVEPKFSEPVDEVLESIWMAEEKGAPDLQSVKKIMQEEGYVDVLDEVVAKELAVLDNGTVRLTAPGRKRARDLIRRHRLAERLLIDVLQTGWDDIEESACQMEHILSDGVVDKICTLLGHPKECPHGLTVPLGVCCESLNKTVESMIAPMTKANVGEDVVVAYILTRDNPRLHKLMSFGMAPGVRVKVIQKSPSYVIKVAETQIALESDIIKDIYIRRG